MWPVSIWVRQFFILEVRYVLDKDYVAGVIVGARLGVSEHIDENLKVFDPRCFGNGNTVSLDKEDYKAIKEIQNQAK